MRLYRLLASAFPHSYAAKIAAIGLAGVMFPVICGYLAHFFLAPNALGHGHLVLAIVSVAAVVSAAATFTALRSLLAPVELVRRTLEDFGRTGAHDPLPRGFRDDAGRLMELTDHFLSTVRTELRISRNAADTDPLTGLLNRRGFDRLRPLTDKGSLIFVDLDRFKQVNDKLGHDSGDLVLSAVAELLRSILREGELVARFGGEEFVVLLPDLTLDQATDVAERIRASAEQRLATRLGPVTISAGVATMDENRDFAAALTAADRAVYCAKRAGRNRVCVAGLGEPYRGSGFEGSSEMQVLPRQRLAAAG
ncbi:diguanylate cyclase [Rhodobacterales bacterium HKCCE2091]|nr:diguanylate cyclase [Rhodobacterales bacterium HKCCE2091]